MLSIGHCVHDCLTSLHDSTGLDAPAARGQHVPTADALAQLVVSYKEAAMTAMALCNELNKDEQKMPGSELCSEVQ